MNFISDRQSFENLVGSSGLASDDRNDMGHFPIYRENAHQDNSSVTTFVRDRAGNPISAIHGEYLLVRSIFDEKTGMSILVDPTPEVLDAVVGILDKPDKNSYDPDSWTSAMCMTVSMLRSFLRRFPDNAVLHCCGTDQIYWHYCPETKALSMDCESLADLPEYENRDPTILSG